jgi:hypothetical protein
MPWERTEEGWVLTLQVTQPEAREEPLWMDDHIKVMVTITQGSALYRIRVDQRRSYQFIHDPRWVAVFFGQSPRIRSHIKGQRLWRDKQIVVQRYGRKPRSYFIVAR